jgi:hypothetical protein
VGLFSTPPPPLPIQRRPAPPPTVQAAAGSAGSVAITSTVQAFAPFGAGSVAATSTVAAVGASLAAGAGTIGGTLSVAAVAASTSIFPLTIDAGGRYLKKNDGTPFLVCGDTTWSLFVDIPLAGINSFLAGITAQGFNAVSGNAIEHHYSVVKSPKERGGNLPFTKRMDGATYTGTPNGTTSSNGTQGQFASDNYSSISTQAPDPTFPNNTYWQACETILDACLAHNVAVFVWPGYLGFHANDEGWMQEMVAWDAVTGAGGFTGLGFANAAKSKMWNYGAWLADRWKAYPHIVWVIGGDYGSNTQTLDTSQKAAIESLMAGLKSVSGQQSLLYSAHWDRPALSSDTSLTAGAFDLNGCYGDEAIAELARRAYAVATARPAIGLEYFYEDDLFGGSVPYRKYMYWQYLGGIAGGLFGNEQLWRFDDGSPGTDYTTLLSTQATNDAARQFAFWNARPWWRLKPSGLGGIGTLVTAGGGTASPQSTTYVAAAATPEGDLLLAYVPPDHTGSVTIDMTKMSATAQARWFDPANATFTVIGAFNNSSTHAFTAPGANSAGDADFLLVLETVAATVAATSTVTGTGAALASTTGTASSTVGVAGAGASIATTAGSAAGTCTVTASAASLLTGDGTVAVTSTVVAVAAALAAGTGTSAGASATTAVGQSIAAGAGSSTATASVAAVGQSTAVGAGSLAISGAASGVGAALAVTSGSAAIATVVSGAAAAVAAGAATVAIAASASAVGQSMAATVGTVGTTTAVAAAAAALAAGTAATAGALTVAAVGVGLAAGSGTGNIAASSTLTAVGAALAAGTGSVAIAGAVAGVAAANLGAGAVSSTTTLTAVGAAIWAGTATASGSVAVAGVGSGSGTSVGSVAVTFTMTAVGAPLASGVASTAGAVMVAAVAASSGTGATAIVATTSAAGAAIAEGAGLVSAALTARGRSAAAPVVNTTGGGGLLDGFIANLVGSALIGAGMSKSGVLIKIAPGVRTPGAVSSGTNPTSKSYKVQAIPASVTALRLSGSLIAGVDRVIKIFGSTLPSGVVPVPGDKITLEGVTSVIAGDGGGNRAVTVDAAKAVWICQCRT